MILSDRTLTILAIVAVGLSALALLVALAAASRRRSADPGGPIALDPALRGILDGHGRELRGLGQAVRALNGTDARHAELIAASVRRVALLRYDAFEDVGGRLSFSCALLDDHGTGVVLTSINGRQETRVYAKPVTEGASGYNLSQEEGEAIKRAMADRAVEAR
jgi:hypothetical protein